MPSCAAELLNSIGVSSSYCRLDFTDHFAYNLEDAGIPFFRKNIMPTMNIDRRTQCRIDVVTPITFRLIEEITLKPQTDWINGFTANISLGGMKVTAMMAKSQAEMLVNQYILITCSCQLPGTDTAIAATAAIAYFLHTDTTSETTKVTIGLSFTSLDNTARSILSEFIRTHGNTPSSQ